VPAASLNCPNCGGVVSSDATQCQYCGAKLATISCPSCFGLNFLGAKFCSHCGKPLTIPITSVAVGAKCPRCSATMEQKLLRDTAIVECPKCSGVWINAATFELICSAQQEQAALLGEWNKLKPLPDIDSSPRYLPCPECSRLMNRLNFARASGVIIDLCRPHGLWFDRDELRRIIEFIHAGGMDKARDKEKRELEEARRELESAQRTALHGASYGQDHHATYNDVELLAAFRLAGGLVRRILK